LKKYQKVLELAKDKKHCIKIHAGVLPQSYQKLALQKGPEAAFKQAQARQYLGTNDSCYGSEDYYSVFESNKTGRNIHVQGPPPSEKFRSEFGGQCISDASMANLFVALHDEAKENDRFLFIVGVGRMAYGYGIPQRIYKLVPRQARGQMYMILAR
jgi:hypothetical protein